MDHPCLDDELVALATLHGLKVLIYGNQDYRGAILFQAPDSEHFKLLRFWIQQGSPLPNVVRKQH